MGLSWGLVGEDVYTCVPPTGYEKDPAVTAAIREFDPGVIPIWRIQLWTAPGEDTPKPYVHHGLARYYPFPRQLRRPFHCEVPATHRGEIPNFLDAILEDMDCEECRRGGPGGYQPWDWTVYYWARRQFDRVTLAAFDKMVEAKRRREEKMRADHAADLEYRKKQIEPWILKQLEKVSDDDWKRYQALLAHREELRKRGIDPGRVAGRKPFVHIRSVAPAGVPYGRVAPAQELKQ